LGPAPALASPPLAPPVLVRAPARTAFQVSAFVGQTKTPRERGCCLNSDVCAQSGRQRP
jgi:hypothetical protein